MLKNSLRYALALLLFASSALLGSPVQAADSKEYLVKAAFVYNFVKFVKWPGDKAIDKESHIDVCVLGNSPMSETAAVFQQASTAKLSIGLTNENSAASASGHCHIIFVAKSEQGQADAIIGALKGKPILTVSDMDGFAERGGMIGFTTEEGKVKLIVNSKAANAGGLHIDAQLLEIALKVIE